MIARGAQGNINCRMLRKKSSHGDQNPGRLGTLFKFGLSGIMPKVPRVGKHTDEPKLLNTAA